jgi:hypothetical protein
MEGSLHCNSHFVLYRCIRQLLSFPFIYPWTYTEGSHLLWIDWRMRRSRITNSSMAALEGAQTRILGTFLRLPCFRYCFWAYKIWMIMFTTTSDLPVPAKNYTLVFFRSILHSTYFTPHHTTTKNQLAWWSLYHTYFRFRPQASLSCLQDSLFLRLI